MAYNSPDNTAVDFEFQSYSEPTNTTVDFTFDKTTVQTSKAAVISQSTATAGLSTTTITQDALTTATATLTADGTEQALSRGARASATATVTAPTNQLDISLQALILSAQVQAGAFRVLSITDNTRGPDVTPRAAYPNEDNSIDYSGDNNEVTYLDANDT